MNAEKPLNNIYLIYSNYMGVENMGYIYKIENTKTNKFYIGSSKDYLERFRRHLRDLRKNRHHNVYLQRVYDKYGEHSFKCSVIEETDELFDREEYWINKLKPEYNIGSVCGGDNYSNHPNKNILKERLVKHLRECSKPKPRYGKDNPNWRGGTSVSYCHCGNKKALNANTCSKCRDRTGENNPFFNKKHNEETIRKLKEKATGVYKGNQERPVMAEGVYYKSVSSCARYYNLTCGAIINRIKKKHFDFYYVT